MGDLQDLDLNISDLARGVNMSRPHISRILSGLATAKTETLATIAAYLGVTIDDLAAELIRRRECQRGKEKPEMPRRQR